MPHFDDIEEILEEIRPRLAMHRGDIRLVDWNEKEGEVLVEFLGGCKGCPLSAMTLKMGVEAVLKDAFPEIKTVRSTEEEENHDEHDKMDI